MKGGQAIKVRVSAGNIKNVEWLLWLFFRGLAAIFLIVGGRFAIFLNKLQTGH